MKKMLSEGFVRLSRTEMRLIAGGDQTISDTFGDGRCAKKEEQCPAPFEHYDGCCNSCDTRNARPGQTVFYCN